MGIKFVNLAGNRFGLWSVLSRDTDAQFSPKWNCVCDCGRSKKVNGKSLRLGLSKSCGCHRYANKMRSMSLLGPKPKSGPHALLQDLTGKRFGRWVVMQRAPDKSSSTAWKCLCDCGNIKDVSAHTLNNGVSTSCGCYRKEFTSTNNSTHGMGGTVEYETWMGIKKRCLNTKSKSYYRYGGRGITVCERWLESFENFYADMGKRPQGFAISLDRKDVDGDYSPENCVWATSKEQNRNRSNNRYIEAFGERRVLAEWAEILNVPVHFIYLKIKNGMTLEEAMERRGVAYGG